MAKISPFFSLCLPFLGATNLRQKMVDAVGPQLVVILLVVDDLNVIEVLAFVGQVAIDRSVAGFLDPLLLLALPTVHGRPYSKGRGGYLSVKDYPERDQSGSVHSVRLRTNHVPSAISFGEVTAEDWRGCAQRHHNGTDGRQLIVEATSLSDIARLEGDLQTTVAHS